MVREQNTPAIRAVKSRGGCVLVIQEGAQLILALYDIEVVWEPTAVQTLIHWKGRPSTLVRVPQRGSAIVAATLQPEQVVSGVELDLYASALANDGRHRLSIQAFRFSCKRGGFRFFCPLLLPYQVQI